MLSDGSLNCTTLAAPDHQASTSVFVTALLLLVMITLAMNLAHYLKHKKITYFGETAIYILFGLLVSAAWTSIAYDPTNKAIQLDAHFFSLVLLPPIIFEGGYSLQRSMFFSNILPIIGLAMFGGFYSTFLISILMYGFSRVLTETGWSFIESLVFGALISSTDPVTVLSLLPSSVDKRLYMFIFGESALNDAVAIILYRFFVGLQADADNLSILPFFLSILAAFGVFLGSFLVGIVFALIYAKVTKHVWIKGYEGAIYEMVMLIVCAYSSYLFAEICDLTGIISIFFTGIGMSHYATPNMTQLTKKSVKVTLRVVCMLFEGFIFLYFGLGLLSFGVVYDPLFLAIFVGRTHVFIVCGLTKYLPGSSPVPMNQQTLMWFSGLRGAVAFALAVSFLEEPGFSPEIKAAIFGTTVMVILFTVIGLGGMTPYMLRWLQIIKEAAAGDDHGHDDEPEVDQTISEQDLSQPVFGWLYRYIRPYFSVDTESQQKVLAVITRHESKIGSRQGSMVIFPSSVRNSMVMFPTGGRESRGAGGETIVLSPLSYSKVETKSDDQEYLIDKSNNEQQSASNLDQVSLN